MLELTLRIVFSLLVVFGLMWLMARMLRRPLGGRAAGQLAVLSRTQVTRGAAVAVVRVLDRALIVGVTEHQVNLLGEADLAALTAPAPTERREQVDLDRLDLEHLDLDGPHRDPRRNGVDLPPVGIAPLAAAAPAGPAGPAPGPLADSALSPQVWRQAVAVLRNRTVRR
ncbi:hypothetical protein GCM10010124_08280 [Pilimelia terevasa]|uniref:Flagellar protein n=1 Tax=Pilimelia terevasa TaxID=53372 RepID=A0A8J3BFE7_9ACTN|nr:flagellar biosynthetic protein FliO [Pilimelia terevasa]GGK18037.1 hypothetical protein GCM10010124_08280 [Pilimelia terevasa]